MKPIDYERPRPRRRLPWDKWITLTMVVAMLVLTATALVLAAFF